MTKSRTLTRLAAGALALVAGCGGSSTGDGNGRVTVLLTDAPATFKAAVVTITKITLQGSGGETVLSSTKTTTNLLTLAQDSVPVGHHWHFDDLNSLEEGSAPLTIGKE